MTVVVSWALVVLFVAVALYLLGGLLRSVRRHGAGLPVFHARAAEDTKGGEGRADL